MKLHDLRPADGARRPKTRVGRGIAAGKGKTAGRGTKGQKARAGGSIPPWFEGGQTPLHMRIPKLRGFRNPFKVEYEVVNVGRIAALVAAGRLEAGEPLGAKPKGKTKSAPITVNQEILRATGLVSSLDKPMKVLGGGDVDVPLFVVADAFSRSAREKIEAAGGTVQVLEIPTGPLAALGIEAVDEEAGVPEAAASVEIAAETTPDAPKAPKATKATKATRTKATAPTAEAGTEAPSAEAAAKTQAAPDEAVDEPQATAAEAESETEAAAAAAEAETEAAAGDTDAHPDAGA
jgi:large subunit ribosomal protein L15